MGFTGFYLVLLGFTGFYWVFTENMDGLMWDSSAKMGTKNENSMEPLGNQKERPSSVLFMAGGGTAQNGGASWTNQKKKTQRHVRNVIR